MYYLRRHVSVFIGNCKEHKNYMLRGFRLGPWWCISQRDYYPCRTPCSIIHKKNDEEVKQIVPMRCEQRKRENRPIYTWAFARTPSKWKHDKTRSILVHTIQYFGILYWSFIYLYIFFFLCVCLYFPRLCIKCNIVWLLYNIYNREEISCF